MLPTTGSGCVLVLGDKDLKFTSSLSHLYDPTKLIVTTPHAYSSELVGSLNGVKILSNLSEPCNSIIETKGKVPIPWKKVQSVLWFVEADEDDSNIQRRLIQNFFEPLAIRVLTEALYDLQVIVTMNNIRFGQLQVLSEIRFMLLNSCIHWYILGLVTLFFPFLFYFPVSA